MENSMITAQKTRISIKTKDVVITAFLISLVFVATKFINIHLPISINGGLIHLGNVILFASAIVFGKQKGAAAGAFGMALFDLLSGWMAWAPFTFIVRGIMGYIIGAIANRNGRNGKSITFNLLAIAIGGLWMLTGYYATEIVLYGNWTAPLTSVPGNVLQVVIGTAGLSLVPVLQRAKISI